MLVQLELKLKELSENLKTNYNASACAKIKMDNKDILDAIKRSMDNNKANRM